jgi:hypothetical protein
MTTSFVILELLLRYFPLVAPSNKSINRANEN